MSFLTSFLRQAIFQFDNFLSSVNGVVPFSTDEDCVLRISSARSHTIRYLPDTQIDPKDEVLEIHLWNEHMPRLKEADDSMAWGNQTLRMFIHGLKDVATLLRRDQRLSNVCAIRGEMIFLSTARNPARSHQMEKLGFTIFPYHSKLGAFGEFWENFYSWWLMWAYNPRSVQGRKLTANHRSEIWISTQAFLGRYGKDQPSE